MSGVGGSVGRRRIPRGPILFVVIAALTAAIVLQQSAPSSNHHSAAPAVALGVSVPPPNTLSASWYCDEGTSTPDGRADETIIVANLASTATHATVTAMIGGDAAPVSRRMTINPGAARRLHVADMVKAAEPGIVVEVAGGAAAVSHELVHGTTFAVEPCTRSAGSDWYFTAGTTAKGSEHYLVLFNPFGDDAVVDVTLLTDTGVQQPDTLQGFVVPRRSRISLPIHIAVPRQQRIATSVHARVGRIVAERTQIFDGTVPDSGPTRQGIAVSLGAQQAADVWYFASGTTRNGGTASVALGNFTNRDTSVVVNVVLAGNHSLSPQTVTVPSRSVVAVDVTARVPPETDYSVTVTERPRSGTSIPVVAEELASWSPASSTPGVASTTGSTRSARRWIVPAPAGAGDGYLTVLNPGTSRVIAGLLPAKSVERGIRAERAQQRRIAAGRIGVFHVARIGSQTGGLVVSADHPVVLGLTILGSVGASISAAIPDPSYTG